MSSISRDSSHNRSAFTKLILISTIPAILATVVGFIENITHDNCVLFSKQTKRHVEFRQYNGCYVAIEPGIYVKIYLP